MLKNAKWIWIDTEEQPDEYVSFKAEFYSEYETATLFIASESDHIAYLNGKRVTIDAFPNYIDRKYVDETDLSGIIKKGKNELIVEVRYEGVYSSRRIVDKAGVIFSVESGDKVLIFSDETVLCGLSGKYQQHVKRYITGQLGLSVNMKAETETVYGKCRKADLSYNFYPRPVKKLVEKPIVYGKRLQVKDRLLFDLGSILGYRDSQENKSSIHKISDDCDIIVILSNAYGIRIDEYKESEGKIKNTEEPGITSLKIHNHYEKAGIVAAGTISIKSDGSYDWNSIKPDKFLSTKILLPDESIIVYCKLSEQELFYISGAPLAGYYIYGSNDLKFPINTEDTENPVDVYLCKYFDYYQLSLYDIINLEEVSPDSSTIAYTIKNDTDEILSVANYIKKESYIQAVSNRKNLYPQEEHTFFYDLSDFDADSSIGVYYSTEQSDNTDMKWEDKLDCISNSMICTLYKKDNGDIDAAKRFSLESTIQTYSFKVINLCADDITINVGTVPKVQNGYNWNYAESGSIKENIVVKANETITIYGKLCENYSFYITDNDGHEWSVDRENKRVVLNKNEIGTLYLKSYKDPYGKIQNTYESDLYPLTIKNDFGEPVFIGLGDVPVNGTSFNWNEENDYSFLDKTILMPDEKCTVYGKLPEGTAFFIQGWQVSGTGNYWGITKNYSKVTLVKTTDDEGKNKLGIEMSQY